jgi:hypothetical protein
LHSQRMYPERCFPKNVVRRREIAPLIRLNFALMHQRAW